MDKMLLHSRQQGKSNLAIIEEVAKRYPRGGKAAEGTSPKLEGVFYDETANIPQKVIDQVTRRLNNVRQDIKSRTNT